MALVECGDCGQSISSKAAACPHCGAPQGKKRFGCLPKIAAALLMVFIGLVYLGTKIETAEPRYEETWHDDYHLGVARALTKNNIKVCGHFRYKQSETHEGEYLVQCLRDDLPTVEFLVWLPIEKVSGPFVEGSVEK